MGQGGQNYGSRNGFCVLYVSWSDLFPWFSSQLFYCPLPCSTYIPNQGLFLSCLEENQKADSYEDVND